MAMRKKKTLKPPSATPMGRVLVMLEQIQEQNRATIEAVRSSETTLRRELSEVEDRLKLRVDVLDAAVRMNSEDIRKNSEAIRQNSEDIRQNSVDILRLNDQVEKLTVAVQEKPDTASMTRLEQRVRRIEERLGL